MRSEILLFVLPLFLLSPARGQVPGLPDIDFKRYFPHILAISEIQKDSQFPDGYQYKFITVRDEEDKVMFLALTRRGGTDRLVRLYLAKGPIASDLDMRNRAEQFGKRLQLKFEVVDLRELRTLDEFRLKAQGMSWELREALR